MFDYLKQKLSGEDKNIYKNIAGAFLVKGGALFLSLFTMPAYIRFFNNQVVLGLWFTILSVLNWILTFDLGIGNGLRNKLTYALTRKDKELTKYYISSAYISIGGVIVICSIIFYFTSQYINWNKFFNIDVTTISPVTLENVVKIVFLGIVLQFILKLVTSIFYALQKSAINNFLTLCSSIVTLLLILILPSRDNDSNVILMAWVYVLAVNVPLLIATIAIFAKKLSYARPNIKYFTIKYAKDILILGGAFFFAQVAYMIIMNTNEILISYFSDAQYVVDYQIYFKLFTLIGTIFSLALTPIWSAVTKALTEKKYYWVRKLYKKLLLFAGLGCLLEFLLIPFLQLIINIWLAEDAIQVNYFYALVFAIFGGLMILNSVLSSIANGAGELKTQVIFFGTGAVIKIPLSWFLVTQLDSWIFIIIVNIISLSLYCIIQPIFIKNYFKKLSQ